MTTPSSSPSSSSSSSSSSETSSESSCEGSSTSAPWVSSTQRGEETEAAFSSLRESDSSRDKHRGRLSQHGQNTSDAQDLSPSLSDSANGAGSSDCWICRDGMSTPENPLVTNVCTCRGSIGWVHMECINEWVFSQRRTNCPNCDATYNIVSNSKIQLPQTFSEEVKVVFWNLFLPFMIKALVLFLGIAVNGFVVPFAIGISFYHAYIFNSTNVDSYINTTIPTAITSNTTDAVTVMTPNGSLFNEGNEKISSHGNFTHLHSEKDGEVLAGFWLWTSVMVYGWICVVLWRGVGSGWRQWCSIFNEEEPEAEPEASPYTMVECMHWFMDGCLERMGCSRKSVIPRLFELGVLMPVSFLISFPLGVAGLIGFLSSSMLIWRLRFPRKKINDSRRRFEEVMERKNDATELDILLWFGTYVSEMLLFSILMSAFGGIVVHFAISPYFISFPSSFEDFAAELTVLRLVLYWLLGAICSMLLMRVETKIIFPLFAPGVDLFFIRSVNLDLDAESAYWNFILVQVFDADPLRILTDFIRVSIIELTALCLFLRIPIYTAFTAHQILFMEDTNESMLSSLSSLPSGFPVPEFEFDLNESNLFFLPNMGEQQELLLKQFWESKFSLNAALYSLAIGFTFVFRQLLGIFLWLLRHPSWIRWGSNLLIVIGSGSFLLCLKLFPITQTHLKAMRPITVWMGRHLFHMEEFLFDAERLSILDRWLCGDGQSEVPVPDPPIATSFVRRERTLPPDFVLPKYLKLRLGLFSVIFFFIGTSLIWAGPVLAITLLLSVVPYSVPLVCGSLNLFFFVLNPKLYFTAVTEFLMISVAIIFGFFLQPVLLCAPLLDVSWHQLVRESVEYCDDVRRTVGEYKGEVDAVDD
ncbi:putative Zn-finger protein [Trypanosoma theileri]|uniref:Putative Zn-finger protein n=1 Tax=Trypanosoma theileri TaxID=67003 RepID=A0A1X0P0A7_9TRYP|nr:putative Zn-finger protein [Trypanosoma theileri]ORC90228.1 putative Zn-finger protein [Trypanosoma theileri]